jgi:hypothetical protein
MLQNNIRSVKGSIAVLSLLIDGRTIGTSKDAVAFMAV